MRDTLLMYSINTLENVKCDVQNASLRAIMVLKFAHVEKKQ